MFLKHKIQGNYLVCESLKGGQDVSKLELCKLIQKLALPKAPNVI